MADLWNPNETTQKKKDYDRETYDPGDRQNFTTYIKYIQNGIVQRFVISARDLLETNNDGFFNNVLQQADRLLKDYLIGRIKIEDTDYMAWEMLARLYEPIAKRYNPKESNEHANLTKHLIAVDRALSCYAKAQKGKRATRLYEQSALKDIIDKARAATSTKEAEETLKIIPVIDASGP